MEGHQPNAQAYVQLSAAQLAAKMQSKSEVSVQTPGALVPASLLTFSFGFTDLQVSEC